MNSLDIGAESWKHLFTLYKLAEMGAWNRTVKVSTEYLAERMRMSQQTASRHLIEMERKGWIKRTITPEGCLTKITDSGIAELKKIYSSLKTVIETTFPPSVTLEGVLFSGLGEGAYYVTRDGYRKQFMEKLGFDPYPGTLNLKLTSDYDLKTRSELETYPAIEVQGFKNETRTYGPVRCFPAIVNNKVKGAVVSAMRSHYDSSVLEIISSDFVRSKLKLKDGNKVKAEIFILP
jgi:riboflavin kinase